MVKIAFLDTFGLKYDGATLNNRGLGGSESAVIYMSMELAKLGFDVTVFNEIENEGVYDNVRYLSKSRCLDTQDEYDVLISLRSCLPFFPGHLRQEALEQYGYDIYSTKSLVDKSRFKVVWLHDTFCAGDPYLEHLCLDGYIDELFCLSDWHSNYIMNGHSWRGRYFEVLKNKVWQTRNGVATHVEEVVVRDKDPNLFVYNSSITKGMIPLVKDCWPEIKKRIPDARLLIIGGYYRGANQGEPDENEINYFDLKEKYDGTDDITFTGIIKQQEIATILKEASLMIYPAVFPETYGISTLEAINYNVPLVGCRFGALEEVAASSTSYLINYDISYDDNQLDRFVSMVEKAYYDVFLRQQKAYACDALKPWIGWDTVALQWKQHLYNKLDLYMDISELRAVRAINKQVIKLFGRRFTNQEDFTDISTKPENNIIVVSPFYNASKFLERCIKSVASQDYDNYTHFLIDDMSDDNSLSVAFKILNDLPSSIKSKFVLLQNKTKKYALRNQVEIIQQLDDEGIVVLLDGDDWLVNNPDIFNIINNEYNSGAEFTYGSCHSLADSIDLIAQPYPNYVHEDKSYREYLFNWGMPYTHLRTFKTELFNKVSQDNFMDENGEFYRAGGDNALFYPLIEACSDYRNIRPLQQVLYVYNDLNKLNDYKVNPVEQNKNAEKIRNRTIDISDIYAVNKIKESIVDKVRDHDKEALALYKNIAAGRTDVWVDDIQDVYIAPRLEWLHNKVSAVACNKDVHILDVGSWTGSIADSIYRKGYENITCLDISTNVIELGAKTYPHLKWIQGDIETFTSAGTYDIVLMCEVLEHLSEPLKTIEFVLDNLLKPGGTIIYTVPSETVVFGDSFGNMAPEHISKLTKDTLMDISNDVELLHPYDGDTFYEWYAGTINKISPTALTQKGNKRILIALPTAKYIESDTFKSIYNLIKPGGIDLDIECFYGYRIDQVRNLICHYSIENNYDYVFFVDSDIVLPGDSLVKLLSLNTDIASGVYIQRKKEVIPEIYEDVNGSIVNMNYKDLLQPQTLKIAGCGFGCVLVKVSVLKEIGYPQFEYHPAIKFEDTYSEDIDFCSKARKKGYNIFVDTSVRCGHLGGHLYSLPSE